MKEGGKPNLADYFSVLKIVDPQGIRRRNTINAKKVLEIFHDLINKRRKLRLETGFDTNNDMLQTLLNISEEDFQKKEKINIEHLMMVSFYLYCT